MLAAFCITKVFSGRSCIPLSFSRLAGLIPSDAPQTRCLSSISTTEAVLPRGFADLAAGLRTALRAGIKHLRRRPTARLAPDRPWNFRATHQLNRLVPHINIQCAA